MKRHIIHLRLETYEPKTKESKKDVLAAEKSLLDTTKKGFKMDLEPYSKTGDIVTLDIPCPIQTFTEAYYVDINDKDEETLYRFRDIVRKSQYVDIIEPDYGAIFLSNDSKEEKKGQYAKKIDRFLK